MLGMPSVMIGSATGGAPVGQKLFTAGGPWVVPDGVTSISIVAVGQGYTGGGDGDTFMFGGGAGAIAYNTVAVTPGETLTVGVNVSAYITKAGNYIVFANGGYGAQGGTFVTGLSGWNGGAGVFDDWAYAGEASGGSVKGVMGGGLGVDITDLSVVRYNTVPQTYGAGAYGTSVGSSGPVGPAGVRIIWGPGRAYPSTNTRDMV